ncbi:MAG TPA: MFS transporter [Ktedonobacteraceae bacterium]|jgi:EmrB/QacA subfamily drug resistance transporter|nr:MFS transporter [Ktedonobacteraceae bacterium]
MVHIVKPPCDDGVIQSAPQTGKLVQQAQRSSGAWVLVATILGSSMAFIDGTVVNVALPVLQADLNASAAQVQWVVEAYALFLSALILVGGSLGDHFGRRRIFALGIMLFAASSMLCGLSPNITVLIFARAVQGIGGALLVPGSLAIISASFDSKQRGQAIGTWSGFTSITSAIGPVLGGWLVQYASWRWVFFINLPMALIVLVVLFWRVPESRGEEGSRQGLDWWGALLATLGLGGVVYGLIQAGSVGLGDFQVLLALTIGIVALVLFFIVEARSATPMVPLKLFRSPTFSGANLLTFLLYAALGASLFFVPFDLIRVQGYSPTAAGAANLPLIIIMFVLSRWSGGLVARYGAKLPLVIGPIIAALGFALFALPGIGGSYWTTFFPAITVLGIGMAVSVAPLTTAVMGAVDSQHSGVASGINNAVARTAGLLAIAVFGIIVLFVFSNSLEPQLAALHLPATAHDALLAQQSKLLGIEIPAGLSSSAKADVQQAIAASFVASFRAIMLVSAALALASAASSWLLIEGKKATE